jgi:6-pyruvoyltetrahydropterin/6-carboxytetrahydropterin synthase
LVYVTRIEHFNAAHRLFRADWSDEQNNKVFGKCANKNWHGHNFTLEVTVKGSPDPETGFVVDLKRLKEIIREQVTDRLDHKNLNKDVPFLHNVQPSIENVISKIWEQLFPHIPAPALLHRLTLHETSSNYCEYYGETRRQ